MSYNGYMYCLYSKDGQKNDYFHKELVPSVKSLRQVVPTANISLYTNISFDNDSGLCPRFDHVIYDENIDMRLIAKAHALLNSPYDKTIFLDTDTIIHRNIIHDIFKVLDEFKFTAVYGDAFNKGSIYPDFNTGLIGVKNDLETQALINEWIELFEKTPNNNHALLHEFKEVDGVKKKVIKEKRVNDQWAFREMFMNNKKIFHILPTYFQYRWHLMRQYPEYAVLTHHRSVKDGLVDKDNCTKKIINTYVSKHL